MKKGGKRERNAEGSSRGGKVGTVKELPLTDTVIHTLTTQADTHTHIHTDCIISKVS